MAPLAVLEADAPGVAEALARLAREDALGQLLTRSGRMAELASEEGDVKLDWTDQLAWVLSQPEAIERVEELADWIRSRFRHLVWSGMGGSVQAVQALKGLGLLEPEGLSVHPLDSTDPAALNRLLRELAPDGDLAAALRQTLMIGVSMGMTSEEPITHLAWFVELLRANAVEPAEHVLVMTLPGSFLDRFGKGRRARRVDVQPDGQSHIAGRMSAPSTHVFLVPAALRLGSDLRTVLERCQTEFGLRRDLEAGERQRLLASDPFVRLAAWLSAQVDQGRQMLLLDLPERWAPLAPWVEQVVEESLGKDGRGVLVFHGQDLAAASAWPDRFSVLRVDEGSGIDVPGRPLAVLRLEPGSDAGSGLACAARFFAGWNLAVALAGYLQGITFAGQPAVEGYKRYARQLREAPGTLPYPAERLAFTSSGRLQLFFGAAPSTDVDGKQPDAAAVLAAVARLLDAEGRLGYFDLTLNGEPAGPVWEAVHAAGLRFGNRVLKRPTKVRTGPRDYHSTEQSETDGPPDLLSLRVLLRDLEAVSAGAYSGRFLHAQALGSLFAMRDAQRPILLATVERAEGGEAVAELLEDAAAQLAAAAG